MRSAKIAVVGDSFCGKTQFIHSFLGIQLQSEYSPIVTVFEDYIATAKDYTTCELVDLKIYDTPGDEAYLKCLPLVLGSGLDCVFLCFSMDDDVSYKNISDNWNPLVRHWCSNAKVVLIGMKNDLSDGNMTISANTSRRNNVTVEDVRNLAQEIEASAFFITSALTGECVSVPFNYVAHLMVTGLETKVESGYKCLPFLKKILYFIN